MTPGVQNLDLSFRLRADVALNLLNCRAGAQILDVGAGTGAFSRLLAANSFDVTAIDVDERNVATFRKQHERMAGVIADAVALPFLDGSFDAVVCMEVLEHVDDDRRAIEEMRRVLRPGGMLLISVPNLAAPLPLLERLPLRSVHSEGGPEHHFRDGYRADSLTTLLAECGFAVEVIGSVGGRGYRVVAGIVSLLHLAYRRTKGQQVWTWADVEADAGGPIMRAYGAFFPVLLAIARYRSWLPGLSGATLLVKARALSRVP